METGEINRPNIFSAEGNRMPPAERPMEYTGVRYGRYRTLRTAGNVSAAEIRKLNAQERRARKSKARADERRRVREAEREAERVRLEAEREAERRRRREEARVARNARRREARAVARVQRGNVVDISRRGGWTADTFDTEVYPTLIRALGRLIGVRRAYMHITVNGEIVRQELFVYAVQT